MSTTNNQENAPGNKPSKGNLYLRRLLYFIVVLTLILLIAPYIIRYELIKSLRAAGAVSVQIDNLDYNPFTAVISIDQLLIKNAHKNLLRVSKARLDVGYFPVLRRRLIINNASLQDADILIEQDAQGELTIAGFKIQDKGNSSESDQNSWQAGIESLTLTNTSIRVHINRQDHLLKINSAKLERLRTWEADNNAHLLFNGALNDARLELDINLGLFGNSLDVSGRMHLDTLELHTLLPDLYGQLTVVGNTVIKLKKQGHLDINHEGDFILTKAKYTHPDLIFSASDITISGKNSLALDKNRSGMESATFTHTGSISIKQSSLVQPDKNIELLRFSKLNAKHINIQSRNTIDLSDISLTQTNLLTDRLSSDSAPMARSELITVDQIRLDDMNKLTLGNIVINKLQLAVERDKQGALIPLNRILAAEKPGTAAHESAANGTLKPESDATHTGEVNISKDPEAALKVKLGSLAITGDSFVQINDESVQPAYRSRLKIKRLELGKLDSTQIQQPTSLRIELLPAKYGNLDLSGDIYPFTPETDLEVSITAKSISLPRLTPYLRYYTGYLFRQGKLDSSSSFKAKDGELTGEISIIVKNLEMAPVGTEKAKLLRKQLGMPLDQALAMLRDTDNNITLNIPVSGNISNPDFSISQVINIAITKAIKTGASSYLIYALGPYGIALALADSVVNSGGYIRLSDIEYEAGQSTFPQDQHDYLQRLTKITLERPEVELHLCAHATEHDRAALLNTGDTQNINHDQDPVTTTDDSVILKLAEQRMNTLKDILTKRYAVKPERIILCKPFVDDDKYANPHIEISL